MGDLLRCVDEHPNAEIVGICDERHEEMQEAIESLSICDDRVFTDCQQCMRETKPEMVILCPPTGCLLYTSPSPRDLSTSRMPSSA